MGNNTDGRRNFIMLNGKIILIEQLRRQIFSDEVRRIQAQTSINQDKPKAKRKGVSRSPPQSCFQSCEGLERHCQTEVPLVDVVDFGNTTLDRQTTAHAVAEADARGIKISSASCAALRRSHNCGQAQCVCLA